ncbi:MAG: hypothetical protein PHW50_01090 [Patescibacteria group bacterium]|nr:hypothetical protein [Patescibacteria group bacterium]
MKGKNFVLSQTIDDFRNNPQNSDAVYYTGSIDGTPLNPEQAKHYYRLYAEIGRQERAKSGNEIS